MMMDDVKRVFLILIRHTETGMNVEQRYPRRGEDPKLNRKGKKQAKGLAKRLSRLPISAVYSSDLERARGVAEPVAAPHGLEVVYDARLRGVEVGSLAGLKMDSARFWYPWERHRTDSLVFDLTDIGGESYEQVVLRHLQCFDDILESHGTTDMSDIPYVAVVGHSVSLRITLPYLGITPPALHEQGEYQRLLYFAERESE